MADFLVKYSPLNLLKKSLDKFSQQGICEWWPSREVCHRYSDVNFPERAQVPTSRER